MRRDSSHKNGEKFRSLSLKLCCSLCHTHLKSLSNKAKSLQWQTPAKPLLAAFFGIITPMSANKPEQASPPRHIRRRLLLSLYRRYLEDPLQMVTPEDILEEGHILRNQLAANAHYLSDRGLIEMMMGYKPPLFAAVRISPKGIDLVEDYEAFNRLFPETEANGFDTQRKTLSHVYKLAAEIEKLDLPPALRDWIMEDVKELRTMLRTSPERWPGPEIRTRLAWLDHDLTEHAGVTSPALLALQDHLSEHIDKK